MILKVVVDTLEKRRQTVPVKLSDDGRHSTYAECQNQSLFFWASRTLKFVIRGKKVTVESVD